MSLTGLVVDHRWSGEAYIWRACTDLYAIANGTLTAVRDSDEILTATSRWCTTMPNLMWSESAGSSWTTRHWLALTFPWPKASRAPLGHYVLGHIGYNLQIYQDQVTLRGKATIEEVKRNHDESTLTSTSCLLWPKTHFLTTYSNHIPHIIKHKPAVLKYIVSSHCYLKQLGTSVLFLSQFWQPGAEPSVRGQQLKQHVSSSIAAALVVHQRYKGCANPQYCCSLATASQPCLNNMNVVVQVPLMNEANWYVIIVQLLLNYVYVFFYLCCHTSLG